MNSRAFIVTTLGPASEREDVFFDMVSRGADVVRFNLSWASPEELRAQSAMVARAPRKISRIADLPGPRVQEGSTHHVDSAASGALTEHDKALLPLCKELGLEYVALSYVQSAQDIEVCRALLGGAPRIIAKIERAEALANVEEIAAAADALMVARGDLGHAIPLEQLPYAQTRIIAAARAAGKPVIVATDMLRSMVEREEPTRAEVNDVAQAILQGADAVMLSEETAVGKHPSETVAIMERIVLEAEQHRPADLPIRAL